ncbi:MAG: hypothetical protein K2N10_06710 [Muribaculaceae bacterium]|nr:hypothetical protein [Muribaculaceae bacterium]
MKIQHTLPAILLVAVAAAAQTVAAAPPNESYNQFRQSILQDFQVFRQGVMNDYSRFLDSTWAEFERFKGESRSAAPKPKTAPIHREADGDDKPVVLPEPTVDIADAPAPQPIDIPDSPRAKEPKATRAFEFYGLPLEIGRCDVILNHRLTNSGAFANQWRTLLSDPTATDLARRLGMLADELGLNDYLTFDLVRKYVQQAYPSVHSTSRAALVHFIMTSLGFDARIATSSGEGVLLLPTLQTIYGRPYMKIGDRKFYVFSETDNVDTSGPISTCVLPADAQTGRAIDMRINSPLNLPRKARPFSLAYGEISLSGELNENIYPMLYRYPQTDMAVYAGSVLDPTLRASLVDQLKSQLDGKGRLEAVDALLEFTQNAIGYATDETSHGFEKPYFLEEWLYYPLNDCEDRATFYTYMLWNALGVECQMITYPGHESASVCMDEPLTGDSYNYKGRTFFISDPTYLGAKTGQCMPNYIDLAPEIEYHYGR